MKVGDYVRTKNGALGKIIDRYKIDDYYKIKVDIRNGWIEKHREDLFRKYIIKSSPNIIDILEEHDFVEIEYYSNRYEERVSRIFEVDFIEDRDVCFKNSYCRLNVFRGEWSIQHEELKPIIKSIVTKEQFSQMEYKVGE